MPVTNNIQVLIDGQLCDLAEDFKFNMSYSLEDAENFQSKQGSFSFGIDLPATQINDKIFNSYYRPEVEDMSEGSVYTGWRTCSIKVLGVELMRGSALLKSATHTRIPGKYSIDVYSQNGDWIVLMQDLTLWDCLNLTPHTFDVATVEASWTNFDSDEFHDYVYAPVRYRQPFDGSDLVNNSGASLGLGPDDSCNIYSLRPSLSIYWLMIRGFRLFGYSVNSSFLGLENYFRRFTMPWTWGDFYDLNSEFLQNLCFECAGEITTETPPASGESGGEVVPFWSGNNSANASLIGSSGGSSWWFKNITDTEGGFNPSGFISIDGPASFSNGVAGKGIVGCSINGIDGAGGIYIFDGNGTSGAGNDWFKMDIDIPPSGYDNSLLYSFDKATGTMIYDFNPPSEMAASLVNISATFTLSLYFTINGNGGKAVLAIECTQIPITGPTSITCLSITEGGGAFVGSGTYPEGTDNRYPLTPQLINFTVQGMNPGEQLRFRLRCLEGGGGEYTFGVFSGAYINSNASTFGIPSYHYNPVTERYDFSYTDSIWTPVQSTLTMTGFLLQIGGTVNFQDYDKFRSYRFLDLLAGVVDFFNLSIQTDPVSRIVSMEPTHDYVLPDGTPIEGYFQDAQLDWTYKQDLSKESTLELYNDPNRQFDFQTQQDGGDGGQNIYAARYKGIYLNSVLATGLNINTVNGTNNENGMIAAMPGASRYMFPSRFPRGSTAHNNRFFSATMHYNHAPWGPLTSILSGGTNPALSPQLICIFPENISDSSASAVSATFSPKIAFYSGKQNANNVGAWRWVGDPNAGGNNIPTYTDGGTPSAIGFQLPYLFAVDYTGTVGTVPGQLAPVLSYCDQNINGSVVAGLMKTYFLKRMAIMRKGKLYKTYLNLTLSDIRDWEHRYTIIINGNTYFLIGIENYNPLSDESCLCTLWKEESPNANDLANMYPSNMSILTNPLSLPQYDLKYGVLLLYYTDIPIV